MRTPSRYRQAGLPERLVETSEWMVQQLGRPSPSWVVQALGGRERGVDGA